MAGTNLWEVVVQYDANPTHHAERLGTSDARRGWTPSVLRWEIDKGVTTTAKLYAYHRGYSAAQSEA